MTYSKDYVPINLRKKRLSLTCKICQKTYTKLPCQEMYTQRLSAFCSAACRAKGNIKEKFVFVASCTQCGEDFTRKTRSANRELQIRVNEGGNVFCGKPCLGAYKKGRPRPLPTIYERVCTQCAGTFTSKQIYRRMCSVACRAKALTIPYKRICKTCEKEDVGFRIDLQSNYCSKECSPYKKRYKK